MRVTLPLQWGGNLSRVAGIGRNAIFGVTAHRAQEGRFGISVSSGSYPTVANQPEAWKESGGFAGTFSPNAAYVETVLALSPGPTYVITLT